MKKIGKNGKWNPWRPLKSSQWGMALCGGFMTLLFIFIFLYTPTLFSFFEQKVYDVMHGQIYRHTEPSVVTKESASRGEQEASTEYREGTISSPVIIDIDEKSLKSVGQWPWPRYRIAELIDAIVGNQPAAVGLDILFPEVDRSSLRTVIESLEARAKIEIPLEKIPELFLDNDRRMAEALDTGNVTLACRFLMERQGGGTLTEAEGQDLLPRPLNVMTRSGALPLSEGIGGYGAVDGVNDNDGFPHWRGILMPLPELAEAVAYRCGFVNAIPDSDGTVRSVPLFTRYQSRFFPSLALTVVMQQMQADKVIFHYGMSGLEALQLQNRVIPISSDGKMMVLYGKNTRPFETISASDLLSHPVEERLKNRMVLVGASAAGLGDHHVTPMNRIYPGVYIHAAVADNILRGQFISRPAWVSGAEFLLTLFSGLIASAALIYLSPMTCLAVAVIIPLFFWGLQLLFLQMGHLYISFLFPFLLFFCNVTLLSVVRFRIGEKAVWQKTRQMAAAQDFTLRSISGLASNRDHETVRHVNRTAYYVRSLARRLSHHPDYREILDETTIEMMYRSAPLHDIGKVAVPDCILLKTGEMTESEFREIKQHTEYGWETIHRAEKASRLEGEVSFLKIAKELIRYHHEKWDGTGYNHGLKGKEIPLAARLMALADVYDGLISTRQIGSGETISTDERAKRDEGHGQNREKCLEMHQSRADNLKYPDVANQKSGRDSQEARMTYAHERAIKIILENRGRHFDPDIVDAFLAEEKQFKAIAVEMADDLAS